MGEENLTAVQPSHKLRQQSLFQFVTPLDGAKHVRGLSKETIDFESGHSLPWGDPLPLLDDTECSTFRILSHNVNGLSTHDSNEDVRQFATAMQHKSVAVFGIQETNRNFGNSAVLQSFHSIIRSTSSHHQGAVSYAKIHWPCDYQPGGTAVSVRDRWATRFLAKGSDDLGRWSWVTLTGQGTTRITFVSGYRVCDGANESAITSRTVRAQQEWLYNDRGLGPVNLRRQFVVDLCSFVKELQAQGHDIVLMMDANEAHAPKSAVECIIHECGLVDAHASTSDESQPPATYQRGSKKIDFIIVSPRVAGTIVRASILALQDGYLSDHRALVVDFSAGDLFNSMTSDVILPTKRRLTSTNPRAVHAYLAYLKSHLARHNIVEKVQHLVNSSETGIWSATQVAVYEEVDNLLDTGRRAAERKCKPRHSGRYPWSPELDKAGKTLQYWKLRLWEFSNRTTNNLELDRLAESVGIPDTDRMWLPSKEVRARKRRARTELRAVQRQATAMREQHNLEAASLAATLHRKSEHVAQADLAARERSSRQFQQLRSVLKAGLSYGVDRIDVPNSFAVLGKGEQVPRIPLVVKEDIEEVLRPHTIRRFRQHTETPFGSGDRRIKLGLDCTSDDALAILDGLYDRSLESLSREARVWLKHLKRQDFVCAGSVISTCISQDDWVAGWSKMRESTASAPGGHYGHYKAAAVAARLPDDHEDYFPELAQVYAAMCSLPLKHGFAPHRWQRCVDAILEKIPGQPLIEKLRIIMLFEADFNFVLKFIWGKRLIRHAESHSSLGTSNHGCRPGRQTSDALLEKLMIYEHARLSRTSLITVDNDAKSCYDRIIKSLAMLACVSYGLPIMAAIMHNLVMHGMEHRMKTRHGYFRPYKGSQAEELEGVGQGSGAGPAIWLIYSVTLLAAFQSFSPGMHIVSPFDTLMVTVLAVFYVDDGMPGVNDALSTSAKPLPQLIREATAVAQSWERLLFASGGALELSKCFAYILYWDLSNGKHRLLDPNEIPGCTVVAGDQYVGPLKITYGNDTTSQHQLATESPWVGRRTLGVRVAPAGNWNDELEYRQLQARDLALRLSGATLPQDTVRLAYRMIICPKLEYPLCVTQFSQDECDSISRSALQVCLSKMGYNRNLPREVVYGPTELGGLGMHDLYIEQGIRQVLALVGHLRQDSATGRMLLIEAEWCQVQAGTSVNLLERPDVVINYTEPCWIMALREFLRLYHLRLSIPFPNPHSVSPLCDADEFVMDALRVRGQCSALELRKLNACRLYLKVSRLSEITSCDGRALHAEALKGMASPTFASQGKWPRQGRPPTSWWALWSRKIRHVFSADGKSTTLRSYLGNWTALLTPSEWHTLFDHATQEVYVKAPVGYNLLHTTSSRGTSYAINGARRHVLANDIPITAVPATLGTPNGKGASRIIVRDREITSIPEPIADSFCTYVSMQPKHIREALAECDLCNETACQVADVLYTHHDISVGTDGSMVAGSGTFGFVFGDPVMEQIITSGLGRVYGNPDSMSSTRAELYAIFAAVQYLRLVIQYFHVILPKDTVCHGVSDSRSALSRLSKLQQAGFGTTWRCRAHYDIEASISACLKSMPGVMMKWEWVRGHASDHKPRYSMSWSETLNDAADQKASAAWQRCPSLTNAEQHWPEQMIGVLGPHGSLCGNLARELRYSCTAPDIRSYWQERYHWSPHQLSLVDQKSLKSALAGMGWHGQRRVQKLRCGWLPVNSRVARHDPDRLAGCSACSPGNLVPETVDHIFQCSSTSRRRAVLTRLADLEITMSAWNTSRHIISALKLGVAAWIEGREVPELDTLNDPLGSLVQKAYAEQTSIGWGPLFRGFLATSWREAQEAHLKLLPTRGTFDSGERWLGKLTRWFFDLFHLVWGLRNEGEHGVELETQRLIRMARCERSIRRLYAKSSVLPHCERHPFREPLETLLQKTVCAQELWIAQTEWFLPKAIKRTRSRKANRQKAVTDFFPRIG